MSHITILFLRGVSYLAAAAFSLGYLVRLARGLAKSAQPSLCPSGLAGLAVVVAVVGLVADLVGPVAGLAGLAVVVAVVGLGSADFAGFVAVVAVVVAATSPSI